MKILQIKINNLASLEGETIIDFTSEPLASAGIFAITGPTGAGKSTILDALCLALYGRTPRYVQAKSKGIELQDSSGETITQGDPRAILRDGTAIGSASVSFIGIDGDKYEATWGVKRAHQKVTGKLMANTHLLHNDTKQREVPGTKTVIQKEIERLLGLNFDQFTRSVLLAQGDFTAFMKADKEEKSALLEKLTGSEIYSEISQKVFEHYKTEEELLKNLRAKAENIDLLTEAQISQFSVEIKVHQNQQQVLATEKKVIDKAVGWHQQKADLETKHSEAQGLQVAAQAAARLLLDTRTQLARVLIVRPLKNIQENLQEEKAHLKKLAEDQQQLQNKLQDLTSNKEKANGSHQALLKQKEGYEQELKDARPLLTAASNLDTKISTAKEQQNELAKNLNEAALIHQKLATDKNTIQTKLQQCLTASKSTQEWLRQRQDRSKIAERTDFILSRLEDAADFLQQSSQAKTNVSSLKLELENLAMQSTALHTELNKTDKSYQSNLGLLQELQAKLKLTDKETQEQDIADLQNKERALEKAQSLFDLFERIGIESAEADQKLADNTQKLSTLTVDLTALQPKVTSMETQVTTTRELIAKAVLRNAANIEQLRAGLLQGDPCPVCGSMEHPYSTGTHTDLADQLLAGLKEELDKAEKAFKLTAHQYTQIDAEISLRQKEQERLLTSSANKQVLYQEAQAQWAATAFFPSLKDKAAADITNWFQVEMQRTKEALDTQSAAKTFVRGLLQDQENLLKTTEAAKNTLQKLKDALKDLKANTDLKSQESANLNNSLQGAEQKLQGIQNALNSYFPTPDWFSNWQQAPGKFTSTLQQFALDWKAKQAEAESLDQQTKQAETELAGYDRQLVETARQLQQHQEVTDKQRAQLETLLNERKALFNGQPVIKVEADLQNSIESVTALIAKSKVQVETIEKDWANTQHEQGILENNIKQTVGRQNLLDQKIGDWISQHNAAKTQLDPNDMLDRLQVESLLVYTDQWITENQAKIRQADLQEQDATSRLQERAGDLQKHLATNSDSRDLEELLEIQATQTTTIDSVHKALLEIQVSLASNQKNIKKLGSFQKDIDHQQKVFDSWAALNSLIGSRDGRKFREIAQQYTLDLLLTYANKHLYVLSKRYVLARIQDSLGIQVIDQDMADEVRSVYSLSGGESFLVSLALALGLASLSSHRLKVESLFIDEGFGSLDPSTLSVAMDALERLQDQGRKVGVISHVQEMTERITVQIRVHKKTSGKSNISVESLA